MIKSNKSKLKGFISELTDESSSFRNLSDQIAEVKTNLSSQYRILSKCAGESMRNSRPIPVKEESSPIPRISIRPKSAQTTRRPVKTDNSLFLTENFDKEEKPRKHFVPRTARLQYIRKLDDSDEETQSRFETPRRFSKIQKTESNYSYDQHQSQYSHHFAPDLIVGYPESRPITPKPHVDRFLSGKPRPLSRSSSKIRSKNDYNFFDMGVH